jgi:secondary thiamine-phosphate synthase enzyme
MGKKSFKLNVSTEKRVQFIDITGKIRQCIINSNIKDGVVYIYTPHTTAAITINENADSSVVYDINAFLNKTIPFGGDYTHLEGNSDAHIKSSVLGCSEIVFVENSSLLLGTWQGIFFCEFDGPRKRTVYVKILEG